MSFGHYSRNQRTTAYISSLSYHFTTNRKAKTVHVHKISVKWKSPASFIIFSDRSLSCAATLSPHPLSLRAVAGPSVAKLRRVVHSGYWVFSVLLPQARVPCSSLGWGGGDLSWWEGSIRRNLYDEPDDCKKKKKQWVTNLPTALEHGCLYYSDVTWTSWRLKSPAPPLVSLVQAHIKENIKDFCHWHLWWIHRTEPVTRKCFYLMTSSWMTVTWYLGCVIGFWKLIVIVVSLLARRLFGARASATTMSTWLVGLGLFNDGTCPSGLGATNAILG